MQFSKLHSLLRKQYVSYTAELADTWSLSITKDGSANRFNDHCHRRCPTSHSSFFSLKIITWARKVEQHGATYEICCNQQEIKNIMQRISYIAVIRLDALRATKSTYETFTPFTRTMLVIRVLLPFLSTFPLNIFSSLFFLFKPKSRAHILADGVAKRTMPIPE